MLRGDNVSFDTYLSFMVSWVYVKDILLYVVVIPLWLYVAYGEWDVMLKVMIWYGYSLLVVVMVEMEFPMECKIPYDHVGL